MLFLGLEDMRRKRQYRKGRKSVFSILFLIRKWTHIIILPEAKLSEYLFFRKGVSFAVFEERLS